MYLKSKIQFTLGYKFISGKSFAEKKFGIQFLTEILQEQPENSYKENIKCPLIEFMDEKKLLTTYILLPDMRWVECCSTPMEETYKSFNWTSPPAATYQLQLRTLNHACNECVFTKY